MLTVLKAMASITALVSSIGVSGLYLAQQGDASAVFNWGRKLGTMSAAEILGIICVISIVAVVYLHKMQRKDSAKHHAERDRQFSAVLDLTQHIASVAQGVSDRLDEGNGLSREVRDAMKEVSTHIQWCKNTALGHSKLSAVNSSTGETEEDKT